MIFCPLFNIFGTTLGEQCPFLAVPVRWYTGVKDGQRTGSAVVTGSAWSGDLDQVTPSLHESAVLSCRVEAFHVTCVQTLKLGFLCRITISLAVLLCFPRVLEEVAILCICAHQLCQLYQLDISCNVNNMLPFISEPRTKYAWRCECAFSGYWRNVTGIKGCSGGLNQHCLQGKQRKKYLKLSKEIWIL